MIFRRCCREIFFWSGYDRTMDFISFLTLKNLLIGFGLAGILLGLLSFFVEHVFKIVERNKV